MPVKSYRKRPVEVEAVQFVGINDKEIEEFIEEYGFDPQTDRPLWVVVTLHGLVEAEVGDWIIKGAPGDYWPCKPDVFETTYKECSFDA